MNGPGWEDALQVGCGRLCITHLSFRRERQPGFRRRPRLPHHCELGGAFRRAKLVDLLPHVAQPVATKAVGVAPRPSLCPRTHAVPAISRARCSMCHHRKQTDIQ